MHTRAIHAGDRAVIGDRAWSAAEVATVLATLAVGAALRLWLAARNAGLTMDSPLYVHMAEALARGEAVPGPAHHGYPALVALAGLVLPGRELPGRAVSLFAGLALLLFVHRVARRVVPAWAAAMAAGLLAVHPLLAVYSGPIMTETTYLAVLFAGLLALERGRPLAGGIGLGLAYVVRPEALVTAAGAFALSRGGVRVLRRTLLGFALIGLPYVALLSWVHGTFMISPKIVLVRPPVEERAAAEWRVHDAVRPVSEPERSLLERLRWAAPGIVARYLPNLAAHFGRLIECWPWPLLLLSVVGLLPRPGPVAAPLLQLLVLPLLAVPPDHRFALLFLPSLAVLAATGAARLVGLASRAHGLSVAAATAVAAMGALWAWSGPARRPALHFDDGPMTQMRQAGEWLRANGRPGATVMDRKAYVAFYAGMRHAQLPDDDYDTILEYARASGAEYVVLEEFVVETLRPQLRPLLADAGFRAREQRLRTVFHVRGEPRTGVAVMEVVREPGAAPP